METDVERSAMAYCRAMFQHFFEGTEMKSRTPVSLRALRSLNFSLHLL